MSVTLQQIAEAAGVSRGTVDRALNNRGRINPEVAEKIRRIAREMGYQPNRAGRALAMSRHSISIGVIMQAADTPFMKEVLKGIREAKEEVERLGGEVMIREIKGLDAQKAAEYMIEMRDAGCKGIALMAVEDENLQALVNEFAEQNISVVTFNSDLQDCKRMCFVGQDTVQSGKVAAGLMAEILPKDAQVLVISGYPSNHGHKNRSKSFIAELKGLRPDVKLLDIQYAYDDDLLAERILREMLKEYKDLFGVYLAASGTEGVCRVLKQEKLAGTVKVISNDLTVQNKQELENGSIQFLIGQNAHVQGYSPVMVLFEKLFDGKEPEKEYAYTEIVIKTKYNL